MKFSRRGFRRGMAAFCMLAACMFAAVSWPRERLLMHQAHRVVVITHDRNYNYTYSWLSGRELLLNATKASHEAEPHLIRIDAITGSQTECRELDRQVASFSAFEEPNTSPDGNWLLWKGEMGICVAHLDGSGFRTWPESDASNHWYWLPDSRHCLALRSGPPR